jgi:hypothetical protein
MIARDTNQRVNRYEAFLDRPPKTQIEAEGFVFGFQALGKIG